MRLEQWYNYPCISQNKTFTIASSFKGSAEKTPHTWMVDSWGRNSKFTRPIRTDGSRVFSVTLDGLSQGVPIEWPGETKGVGNMVPANTGVRVLYSRFIIFRSSINFGCSLKIDFKTRMG